MSKRYRFFIYFIFIWFFILSFSGFLEAQEKPAGPAPSPKPSPAATSEPSPSPTPAEISAIGLLNEVWLKNQKLEKFQGTVTFVRVDDGFLRELFPVSNEEVFTDRMGGVINYTENPKIFRLLLHEFSPGDYTYRFSSNNGYDISLAENYNRFLMEEKQQLNKRSYEERVNGIQEFNERYFLVDRFNPDGSVHLNPYHPLNLIFPFSLKDTDPSQKIKYVGKNSSNGRLCNVVEIESEKFGKFHVYISQKEPGTVYQIDRFDKLDKDYVYATAIYSNFKEFLFGGKVYREVELIVAGDTVLNVQIEDLRSKHAEIIDPTAVDRGEQVETPGRRRYRDTDILIGNPLLTAGAAITVLIMLVILTIIAYRFWFFKEQRRAFAREVIVYEGNRPEEKISHLLVDLGVPNTPFTPEKLTKERELLVEKSEKKPRLLVVGPGMFSKLKSYNFLIKGFVADGGRVVVLEHGVENSKHMPFNPTFMPYDWNDPSYVFVQLPKWKKIWRQTSLKDFEGKTKLFLPYELLVRINNRDIEVEPIIAVNNPNVDITAAAIAMIYEGKGEYMLIQYRLIDAIKNMKLANKVAENMLADLLIYMFGRESAIEFAPQWLLNLFGIRKPGQ
ncbi:MAG: hypothetical protein ACLFQV_06455 [Vulcanimicrobiota bacterium]